VALAAATVVACGTSTDTSDRPTEITPAAIEGGIRLAAPVVAICQRGGSLRADPGADHAGPMAWLGRVLEARQGRYLRLRFDLGPTRPADQFGDCGGRVTYPVYSHAGGVTSGTLAFENYCTLDQQTGERSILDGRITFVNRGTPSPTGPITNSVEANSTDGISAVTRSSTGATLSSQRVSFRNYRYVVGVPGGSPTPANPNRVTLAESSVTDLLAGKTYRQTDITMTAFRTTGGEQVSLSGRGYRSNGEYFTLSTTAPLLLNAQGDFVSGQLTFTGARNTTAVLTIVPGPRLQATLTVNGAPVTNLPACR
jgi:hypothetical protein